MRILATAIFAATMALSGAASAQVYSTDPYAYDDGYPPGSIVVTPPRVGAPMNERPVYLAPDTAYIQPGTEYTDNPIYIDGQRYYRDCWWDWGQRRCELKRWW